VYIHASSKTEQELFSSQAVYSLSTRLRAASSDPGTARLVPLCLPMSRIVEMLNDETKRTNPRDMLIKAFEVDHPQSADMLRQAMELRAVVLIAEVSDISDFDAFNDSVMEELMCNRLFVIASGIEKDAKLPATLKSRCDIKEVCALGLYLNSLALAAKTTTELFRHMKQCIAGDTPVSPHGMITALHVSSCEIERETMQEMQELLSKESCSLTSLDVSNTKTDCYALMQVMRGNISLTSLDLRAVPKAGDVFESIGEMLLRGTATCQLCYFRCDAFDLLENVTSLSLREKAISKGAIKLLVGLLKHNDTLLSLDLEATNLDKESATELVNVLTHNKTLSTILLAYNPALDDDCKKTLMATAAKHNPEANIFL
jgi:hypothetical protein